MSRIERLLEFIEEEKNDPFLYFALAQEYEKQDQLKKALEYYLLLTRDFPDYVGTYYHLGHLYQEIDDSEKALQIYAKGIEVASAKGDHHALSELRNAKTNCELGV